ncbi:NAD(P)-binding domain-containing protein, partial [Caballeronia terrestris]|uniref:NAD(P)-binding domain-containing protein n=1 Tax=Caballeronia terrestris TaxID=1226301 RepID=UPI000A9493F2
MEIGIIGLGAMGRAMARNLARAGHDVKAWYRSGGSVEGVTMVASPVEAFQGDAVFTMLSD